MRVVEKLINVRFWPRSFRFGRRYSQKCSLFSQKRIKCSRVPSPLHNIQQFSRVWCPLGFKNAGLWLWKWWDLFSRISAPIFFPVSWQIFYIYDTQISTENIYRILIKQTGQRLYRTVAIDVCLFCMKPSSFPCIFVKYLLLRWFYSG